MNSDKMNKLTRSLKKYLALTCAVGTMAFASFAQAAPEEAGQQQSMTVAEMAELAKENGYKHTSTRYGYSIVCPKKPNVIPLSIMEEKAKGEVLIFDNDEYYIKNAWIIMVEAFEENEIPANIHTMDEAAQAKLVEKLSKNSGYELVRVADMGHTSGVYCITAKEIEIDTNGDGKVDEVLTSDTQMIKTFFRGQFGGRFAVELIDNPDLTPANVSAYQVGLLTFQEWPTTADDKKGAAKAKNSDKK
ncbi:MAG: hypothetical protein Q4D07_08440 [Selenomonadaceae bacterium]|nr:hypothetical protein [Selenomonadaceae bacterium]